MCCEENLAGQYSEALETFERLVEVAVRVSDSAGGIHTSDLGIESTKIYTRLTLASMTLMALFPGNSAHPKALWDLASVATLVRSFMESTHRYLYLSEIGLSEQEAAFRLNLHYFHMNSEKYRLNRDGGTDESKLQDFRLKLEEAKSSLCDMPFYAELSSYKANKIKDGNSSMHLTDEEAAVRFALDGGRYRAVFRILSNQSHGMPFATYAQSNIRGRGVKNDAELQYFVLFLFLLNRYLSRVILSQVELLALQSVDPEGIDYARNVFAESRT